MNWIELVKKHWPGIDNNAANDVLWSATCFPMGDVTTIEEQIKQAYIKGNGNVGQAIAMVEDEMFEEFKRYKVMEVLKNG
jgi:hypothetical protein